MESPVTGLRCRTTGPSFLKPIDTKRKAIEEYEMVAVETEPLSPTARLFHDPTFNVHVVAIMATKTRISPQPVKEKLELTLLKHPRFTSLLADSGKLGESDSTSILRFEDEELDGDACLGQVPDTSWAVPQVPSPPTASGVYWPKTYQNPFDCSMFVPDISYSPSHNLQQRPPSGTSLKRRRQC